MVWSLLRTCLLVTTTFNTLLPAVCKALYLLFGAYHLLGMCLGIAVAVCLKGRAVLEVKERTEEPECLGDPELGTHEFVTLDNGVALHYVSAGSREKPLVLLLHGFPEIWYTWRKQIPELKKNYWVVAADLRGYGQSTKPSSAEEYQMSHLVEDVRDLVQSLERKRVILVGHDWGALISWCFANRYPEMVDKLVVINGGHPDAMRELLRTSPVQMLKSGGRVLSTPYTLPTGDGVPAPTTSPLRVDEININQFVSTVFQQLQNTASCSTSSIGCATTLAEKIIPEFHAFKNDPTTWVSAVKDVAARHSWPDHMTKSFAEGRLRGAAEAWNRFKGSAYVTWSAWSAALTSVFAPLPSTYDTQFMEMRSRRQAETEDIAAYIYEKLRLLNRCNIEWASPAARQYVVDGLFDPTHAAILSAQSFQDDLETFVRRAVLLQDTAVLPNGKILYLNKISTDMNSALLGDDDDFYASHNAGMYHYCDHHNNIAVITAVVVVFATKIIISLCGNARTPRDARAPEEDSAEEASGFVQ
ncbi:hypothetical protein HPB50_011132 [Hyalomma asiaticum]|uniref:Uncharacterized protein n=1 Tax=Hyalomma asiaticum TaxID=266040 RepID=A0ACB7RWS6_HYAAI|nr:hypothetical protein HPB50_011132 [Hyalomma asiaticum]